MRRSEIAFSSCAIEYAEQFERRGGSARVIGEKRDDDEDSAKEQQQQQFRIL
jgi:hypothetical protein